MKAVKWVLLLVVLLLVHNAHARALQSLAPASDNAASHWGYWVDHPERSIPMGTNPCNALAERDVTRLKALGYHAYYLMAFITRGPYAGEGHIMAAVDFDGFTAVWDSLRPAPVTAGTLRADGYELLGRELHGRWYSVF